MATESKTGRPSDYLPEVAADICSLLADGESLRKVCERPGMPNKSTVFRWLAQHEEFRDQYAKATETRADAIFEEMFDIADTVAEEAAAVGKARLRIDTRKWALARMNPKKYGDKVSQEIDHKSSDGSMTPQPTTIQLVPVEPTHEPDSTATDTGETGTTFHSAE
ncbi:ubiquitin carboxyl-hydrolase [Cronobacter sakazakii]|uniref:terminase small subunit-like protein n=1 Tax=Cronobacter malonaticus TaxID=413503 RepID=UPI0003A751E1|nr:ubiquitin carboxyl-hydrolase [Cronobacter malonaticus]EMC4146235.1 ubiquitin carboxyl-hydrolase [Cronobacter sakazakii]ALX78355.1 ubiquitin carboxyl-hydrolase [Cronobacter malonaticus LMG 23826]ELY4445680.1 ubiquitin carboxyl-hydrolase [Cronobacter malonaticus]ELY4491928.1 ubiquitin carboxyl-hydrolase [Cronobacter malonaticus]ELY6297443.1 ubiquitin carboxyl-hydrolase [Cronobacter malonaticus]